MRLGCVCRWKPVHLGHEAMLLAMAERAGPGGRLRIGLGSPNRHDLRNPFTAAESASMIDLVLAARGVPYDLVEVEDLGDGPRWRVLVLEKLGPLDLFVTANGWVRTLLAHDYSIAHPATLVPKERQVAVDGTLVRRAMARGERWEALVPSAVADFLRARGLVDRFRREFGLATLSLELEPPRRDTP